MAIVNWAGKSGTWSSSTSWLGGVVPGSGDVAAITATTGPYTALLNDTRAAGDVTLNSAAATLQLTGDLSMYGKNLVAQAGTLVISGTLEGATLLETGAAILFSNLDPATNQIVTPTLTYVTVAGVLDLSVSPATTLDVQGLQQTNGGGIRIGAGSQLVFLDSNNLIGETIDLAGGSLAEDGPSLVIGASAVVVQNAAGTTGQVGADAMAGLVGLGLVTNQGTILAQAGTLVLATAVGQVFGNYAAGTAPPPVRNLGTIEIAAGATLVDYASGNVASLGTILNAGGLLDLAGTLDNGGNTLAVGTSGTFSNLMIDAIVTGGTILEAGGTLAFGGGVTNTSAMLNNITLLGAGASFSQLRLGAGVALDPGGAPFALNVTDAPYGYLVLGNGAILANAVLGYAAGANTLTLSAEPGATATLDASTTINVGVGQFLTLDGGSTGTFVDNATINVAGGGALTYGAAQFTTHGTLNIAPGAIVRLTSSSKLADLGTIVGNGGTLINQGALDLGGGTIDLSGGGAFASVTNVGGLLNGTVIQSTGTYEVNQGGLTNATFEGALNLLANGSLTLAGNLHLTGANGTGRGTLSATDFPAPLIGGVGIATRIEFADATTLSNADVYLSGYGAAVAGTGANPNGVVLGGIVTFAPDVVIHAGTANGGNSVIFGGALISQGTIAVAAGADLLIEPYRHTEAAEFVNTGVIAIDPGGTLDINAKTTIAAIGTVRDNGGLLRLLNVTGTIDSGGGLDTGFGIGTYDNTGNTLTIGAAAGQIAALELQGAQINGGTIVNAGGLFAAVSSQTRNAANQLVTADSTLSGVAYVGALHLGTAPKAGGGTGYGVLTFIGGTLNSQAVTLDANSQLNLGADQSFVGATLSLAGGLSDIGHTLSLDANTVANVTGNVFMQVGHLLNAGTIVVGPGGFLNVQESGATTTPAASGTIVIGGGQVLMSALSSGQTARISAGGLLSVGGQLAAGATVAFQGPGTLLLGKSTVPASAITGFGPGDTIDISGFQDFNLGGGPAATFTYDGATLTVLGAQGQTIDRFAIGGGYDVAGFNVTTGGGSPYFITDYAIGYTAPGSAPLAPAIAGTLAAQPTTDESSLSPFANVVVTDPNAGATDTAIVSVSGYGGTLSSLGAGTLNASTYSVVGTAAAVQAALRGLVFTPASHIVAPTTTATTNFKLAVSDAVGIATDTTTSVVATAIDDKLVIAGVTPVVYVSDVNPAQPFQVVSLADPDLATYTATVLLSDTTHGTFGQSANATIDPSGVFTASGSLSYVSTALQNLVFYPSPNQVPTGQTVTTGITATISDGAGQTVVASSTVIVTATGPADVKGLKIVGALPGQPVLDTGTIAPFANVAVFDPKEPGVLDTLTVAMSNAANGTLSDTVGGKVTNSGHGFTVSGTVDASGFDSVINKALAGLIFTPTQGQVPAGSTVTTGFTVTASNVAGSTTDAATSVIATGSAVTPPSGPTISGTRANQPATDQSGIAPFAAVVIGDSNAGAVETVSVTPTSTANGTLSNLGGGTVSPAGVYGFSGSAAAGQTALRGLVFTPTPHQATPGQTVTTGFALTVADGIGPSASDASISVIATSIEDAPVIGGTSATPLVIADTQTPLPFSQATIADPDFAATEAATITLLVAGQPSDAGGALSGGGLTRTGVGSYALIAAAPAVAQAALRAVVFTPAPNTTGAVVATNLVLQVSDGIATPTGDSLTVVQTTPEGASAPVDAYTIGATQAGQATTDAASLAPFAAVVLGNPFAAANGTATVTLSTTANGTLSGLGAGTLSPDGATYRVAGSTAGLQSALRGLVFTPTAHEVAPGSAVTTGFALSVADSVSIVTDGATTVVATALGATPFAGLTVASPVAGDVVSLVLGARPAQAGAFSPGLGGTASADGTTYSFTGTVTATNTLLRALGFTPAAGLAAPSGVLASITSASGKAALTDLSAGHDQLTALTNNTLTTGTGGSAVVLGAGDAAAILNGNDTVTGGAGRDTVSTATASVLIKPGSGPLRFANGTGISTILGGGGSVSARGGMGGGVFTGGAAGGNQLVAGLQATTLLGAAGGDQLYLAGTAGGLAVLGAGSETVFGNGSAGNDIVYTGVGAAGTVVLGSGNDMVFARGNDLIMAGPGSDTIGALASANVLVYGTGGALNFSIDGTGTGTVGGGSGSNTVYGAGGGGVFSGGAAGSNVLIAGLGATTLFGGGAGDKLFTEGGAGDLAVAGSGNETIYGGGSTGDDTIYTGAFDGSGNSVAVLGAGNDLVYARGTDIIAAGSGSATIGAVGAANVFAYGTGGRLTFFNGSGTATVGGGGGSDTLYGGQGGGEFFGGSGGANVLVAGVGASTLVGGGPGDVLTAVNRGGDVLIAGTGNETLNGAQSGGADSFFAKAATAQIFGGYGADRFFGGTGAATITAGSGADVLGFVNGAAGGKLTVVNFSLTRDQLYLEGYGAGAGAAAVRGATLGGGSSSITLPDQTRITFVGLSSIGGLTITG